MTDLQTIKDAFASAMSMDVNEPQVFEDTTLDELHSKVIIDEAVIQNMLKDDGKIIVYRGAVFVSQAFFDRMAADWTAAIQEKVTAIYMTDAELKKFAEMSVAD